jgi:ribosome-associated protein
MSTDECAAHPAAAQVASVTVQLPITVGQFIKVCGFASTGGEAKLLVTSGAVKVNGETDTRRGRKLLPGDVVSMGTAMAVVAAVPAEAPPASTRTGRPGP